MEADPVLAILCALASLGSCSLVESTIQASARELYQQAAGAIGGGQPEAAIAPLESLLDFHAASPLAEVAAFHLAECYCLQGRAEEACELLGQWLPRIDASETAEVYAPQIKTQSLDLFRRALRQLPHDPATRKQLVRLYRGGKNRPNEQQPVEQQPEERQEEELREMLENSGCGREVSLLLALELVRRGEQSLDFAWAQSWLERAVQLSRGPAAEDLSRKLRSELPLAWAQHELVNGGGQACLDILAAVATEELLEEQQVALRFLRAEALLATGRNAAALRDFEWLQRTAEASQPAPDWLAGVALRRAELYVRGGEYATARTILLAVKEQQAEFPYAFEFDYLLARCAIADIDFEQAEALLQQVMEAPQAAAHEALPRATWMLGEVYFLQRKFDRASTVYRRVVDMENYPQWQAHAWLQLAKCHELLAHPSEALAAYRQVVENYGDSPASSEASERLAIIRANIKNLR
ncbi:MAG: tetratricopeptide repeat protein [Planctomycetales bacterium]|nr:tetratricopeptide repeat protein [Planctomycetales bacterium]